MSVRDSAGAAVDGEIVVSDRETRWAFAPRVVWRRAAYSIDVDTQLEDLAGNNLEKLFDVAPAIAGQSASGARWLVFPFGRDNPRLTGLLFRRVGLPGQR